MSMEKKFRQFQKDWRQGKYRGAVRGAGLCLTTACVVLLGVYFVEGRNAEKNIDALRDIRESAAEAEDTGDALAVGEREIMGEYRELFLENPDLIGWLTIEGTAIDYPVMWTPEDPEYYSDKGFDRESSKNGLLFLDASSNVNEAGGNLIVYGHNMKNGSMFADLLNYRDESFMEEHTQIQLDTLYESRVYEVAAVAEGNDMSIFPYGFTYADEANAEAAIESMTANSLYDCGVEMAYGDDFLTLSTCDYSEEDGRLVVFAKRIQ